jgi:hypothetical protein
MNCVQENVLEIVLILANFHVLFSKSVSFGSEEEGSLLIDFISE